MGSRYTGVDLLQPTEPTSVVIAEMRQARADALQAVATWSGGAHFARDMVERWTAYILTGKWTDD